MFHALSADNPESTHFYLSDPRFAKFYSRLQMSVIGLTTKVSVNNQTQCSK